jgi:hypothetical protein
VLVFKCYRRLRVAVDTKIKVVAELTLVSGANDGFGASITLMKCLVVLRNSIEELESSLLLILKTAERPALSDWRVLLVALLVEVVGESGDARGWTLGRKVRLRKKSIQIILLLQFGLWLLEPHSSEQCHLVWVHECEAFCAGHWGCASTQNGPCGFGGRLRGRPRLPLNERSSRIPPPQSDALCDRRFHRRRLEGRNGSCVLGGCALGAFTSGERQAAISFLGDDGHQRSAASSLRDAAGVRHQAQRQTCVDSSSLLANGEYHRVFLSLAGSRWARGRKASCSSCVFFILAWAER